MIWHIELQYEIEFLTRFLETLLSCSYFAKNVIRRSREVDSIAPPTLIVFEEYVMNLQTLLQRKGASEFPSCLSSLFHQHLPPIDLGGTVVVGGAGWW